MPLQPGQTSCYKAIYFNIEPATLKVVALLLLWFTLASRGLEALASAALGGSLSLPAAGAVLVNQFSMWYSLSAMMHYTNDYWFNFYSSQVAPAAWLAWPGLAWMGKHALGHGAAQQRAMRPDGWMPA